MLLPKFAVSWNGHERTVTLPLGVPIGRDQLFHGMGCRLPSEMFLIESTNKSKKRAMIRWLNEARVFRINHADGSGSIMSISAEAVEILNSLRTKQPAYPPNDSVCKVPETSVQLCDKAFDLFCKSKNPESLEIVWIFNQGTKAWQSNFGIEMSFSLKFVGLEECVSDLSSSVEPPAREVPPVNEFLEDIGGDVAPLVESSKEDGNDQGGDADVDEEDADGDEEDADGEEEDAEGDEEDDEEDADGDEEDGEEFEEGEEEEEEEDEEEDENDADLEYVDPTPLNQLPADLKEPYTEEQIAESKKLLTQDQEFKLNRRGQAEVFSGITNKYERAGRYMPGGANIQKFSRPLIFDVPKLLLSLPKISDDSPEWANVPKIRKANNDIHESFEQILELQPLMISLETAIKESHCDPDHREVLKRELLEQKQAVKDHAVYLVSKIGETFGSKKLQAGIQCFILEKTTGESLVDYLECLVVGYDNETRLTTLRPKKENSWRWSEDEKKMIHNKVLLGEENDISTGGAPREFYLPHQDVFFSIESVEKAIRRYEGASVRLAKTPRTEEFAGAGPAKKPKN